MNTHSDRNRTPLPIALKSREIIPQTKKTSLQTSNMLKVLACMQTIRVQAFSSLHTEMVKTMELTQNGNFLQETVSTVLSTRKGVQGRQSDTF